MNIETKGLFKLNEFDVNVLPVFLVVAVTQISTMLEGSFLERLSNVGHKRMMRAPLISVSTYLAR